MRLQLPPRLFAIIETLYPTGDMTLVRRCWTRAGAYRVQDRLRAIAARQGGPLYTAPCAGVDVIYSVVTFDGRAHEAPPRKYRWRTVYDDDQ